MLKPILCRLKDCNTLVLRRMNASPDIGADFILVGVRILLTLESLYMAVALLIGVIDNPGFPLLATPRCPFPLANRHSDPRVAIGSMSRYVAQNPPVINLRLLGANPNVFYCLSPQPEPNRAATERA